MADVVTRKQLEDASQDAATLAAFANGVAGDPNVNRAGEDVQNLLTFKAAVNDVLTGAGASADRAEAGADRAENAATAAALSIGTYYPTIAAGRAAVADGQSFWVEPNSIDALTRFTMFTRTSASTQTKKFEAISASELDQYLISEGDTWEI